MQYWTTGQAALRILPVTPSTKLCEVPPNTVVEVRDVLDLCPPKDWAYVHYFTASRTFTGWVHKSYLETYVRCFPYDVVGIPYQTPNPHDLTQYMYWKTKATQVNFCGPICCAHILNVGIAEILENWEAKLPSLWKRVFARGVATGTDIGDLDQIFEMYALDTRSLSAVLKDECRGYPIATPGRLKALLAGNDVIVGVKISTISGDLQKTGALHWVVIEDIVPNEINNGTVLIYNPATDSIQQYSWREFQASMGVPYGLVIPH